MMHLGQTKSPASRPPAAETLENCTPALRWTEPGTIKDVYLTACSATADNALPRVNVPQGTHKKKEGKKKKLQAHATSLINSRGGPRCVKAASSVNPGAPKTNSFIYRAVGDALWRRM